MQEDSSEGEEGEEEKNRRANAKLLRGEVNRMKNVNFSAKGGEAGKEGGGVKTGSL